MARQLFLFAYILGMGLIPHQFGLLPPAMVAGIVLVTLGLWLLWWWRSHPKPVGMAAVLVDRAAIGIVLLVTDTAVLTTTMRRGWLKAAAPARQASPLPGLVAVSAEEEKLVLGFADGSVARMRQRQPTKGFAARAAAWAAPALERQLTEDERVRCRSGS